MPNNYVWVPVGGDNEMELFAYQLSATSGTQRGAVIRRADGGPTGCLRYGDWGNLTTGDKLSICGHGSASSTKKIGWVTPEDVVIWQHNDLANAIASHLTDAQKLMTIQYELIMCWSADSILTRDPFGYRLACDLGRLGVRGTVIGYKGAVIMSGGGRSLIVQGGGRLRSWFGSEVGAREFASVFQPRAADPLYVNKFNHYDYSKQRRTWNIP
jgi:hypothetical protein